MNLNQAFEILRKHNDARDAKIVLQSICPHGDNLSFGQSIRVRRGAKLLSRGVPVAKIIGKKWFYGLEFETGYKTLDPRPDSETLVEYVINYAKNNLLNNKALKILDLGTGTGCLLFAVLHNFPTLSGIGIDISTGACRIAKRNVKKLGIFNRAKILRQNMKSFMKKYDGQFDIIISNPPYIPDNDLRVNSGAKWDPKQALYGGKDGLYFYRLIAAGAGRLVKKDGLLVVEIGAGQSAQVKNIFKTFGWKFKSSAKDLSGKLRVLSFIK